MADQEKRQLKPKDKIQIVLLTVILVVFPGVSWYWLNQGLDYRKTAKAELKDHGPLPAFEWRNYNGKTLFSDDLKGAFVIAGVYDLSKPELSERFGKELARLHDQFDDRKDVYFLSITGKDSTLLPAFIDQYKLRDTSQCFFISATSETLKDLAGSGFRMPASDAAGSPYIAFADTASVIRNYYDVHDDGQLRRLVQHITLLLPMEKSRDELKFKRETEK